MSPILLPLRHREHGDGTVCHQDRKKATPAESPGVGWEIPHPGCFGKRAWICLIVKELAFLRMQKSPQSYEKQRASKVGRTVSDRSVRAGRGKEDLQTGFPEMLEGKELRGWRGIS